MQSYDYSSRQGIHPIGWMDFHAMARRLAEELALHQPDAIIGIARAGLIPAAEVAYMLRTELYPIRLTRRQNDQVVYPQPVWVTPVPEDVAGKVIAVVDEIASRGETLAMAADAVRAQGAQRVITACLVSHSWANPQPDLTVLVSDALVIFPWGRHIWLNGRWQPHPEYVSALESQGLDASALEQNL